MTSVKIRRGPCDDGRDFKPVVRKAHAIKPIRVGIGDKGYDDEKNHELLREELHAMLIIPAKAARELFGGYLASIRPRV